MIKKLATIFLNLIGGFIVFFINWAEYRTLKTAYLKTSFWNLQYKGYKEWVYDLKHSFNL